MSSAVAAISPADCAPNGSESIPAKCSFANRARLSAWAFATLLSATILTASTAYFANGVAAGAGGAVAQAARSINPAEVYVDKLLRPAPGSQQAAAPASAAEPNAAAANTATSNTYGSSR